MLKVVWWVHLNAIMLPQMEFRELLAYESKTSISFCKSTFFQFLQKFTPWRWQCLWSINFCVLRNIICLAWNGYGKVTSRNFLPFTYMEAIFFFLKSVWQISLLFYNREKELSKFEANNFKHKKSRIHFQVNYFATKIDSNLFTK